MDRDYPLPKSAEPLIAGLLKRTFAIRPELNTPAFIDAFELILPEERGYVRYPSFCVPLADARKLINDDDFDYSDFVYIRCFGLVLFNVWTHTSHEIFMTKWRFFVNEILNGKGDEGTVIDTDHDCKKEAEFFLHEGHGTFVSSSMNKPFMFVSNNHPLNFQERKVFERIKTRELDPGDHI